MWNSKIRAKDIRSYVDAYMWHLNKLRKNSPIPLMFNIGNSERMGLSLEVKANNKIFKVYPLKKNYFLNVKKDLTMLEIKERYINPSRELVTKIHYDLFKLKYPRLPFIDGKCYVIDRINREYNFIVLRCFKNDAIFNVGVKIFINKKMKVGFFCKQIQKINPVKDYENRLKFLLRNADNEETKKEKDKFDRTKFTLIEKRLLQFKDNIMGGSK